MKADCEEMTAITPKRFLLEQAEKVTSIGNWLID